MVGRGVVIFLYILVGMMVYQNIGICTDILIQSFSFIQYLDFLNDLNIRLVLCMYVLGQYYEFNKLVLDSINIFSYSTLFVSTYSYLVVIIMLIIPVNIMIIIYFIK